MAIIRVYRHVRLCAACFLSCLVTCVSAVSAPALDRPNILILLTDDQRWDTICANNPSQKIALFDLFDAE